MSANKQSLAFIITILAIAILPATLAITYTDDTAAEFLTGTASNVNASNDNLTLSGSPGSYAGSGTYTSRVIDMGQNPNVTIAWNFATPTGTTMLIQTRTGNSTNTADGSWSAYSSAYATSTGSAVTSPVRRFIEYRISLGTSDPNETPIVTSVTVTSTENPTNTSLNTGSYTNLTSNQLGTNYTWPVTITETYTITSVTGRTRINSSTWTAWTNLTGSGSSYSLAIPPPGGSWYALSGSTLGIEVQVNATNGTTNTTNTTAFTEVIEFVSTAPVIDPIANYTITQGQNLTFAVTATDFDNHTLTWSATQGATMTSTSATSATFTWSPNATQTGTNTITVTANDGYVNGTRSFTVTVNDTNDAPTIAAVSAITGYYGIRQLLILSAFDYDYAQNLTFTVSPSFFRITTTNISPSSNDSNATPGQWYGVANFTPLDDERGTHTLTFTATDGELSASTNATMTINYCGDAVCQSTYESATTCSADCVTVTETPGIAIVAPDRNCANQTGTLTFYDARNRYACYNDGRVADDLAVCEGLESVGVAIYLINGTLLTSVGTGTSGTNGTLTFQPATAGQYRVVATRDGYQNASATITVRACTSDIVIEESNTIVEQPGSSNDNGNGGSRPIDVREEEPFPLEEEASVLVLLFVYVITPVLLASLLYFGNVFYDVNKDTLPWLLELRIKLVELRQRAEPGIQKARTILKPITEPLMELVERILVPYLWSPTKKALQPLLDRMNESLKKDSKPPPPKQ